MSIRARFILAALAAVALVTAVSVVYTIDRERRMAVARLYNAVREDERVLSVVTAGPLYDGNVAQLATILESIFANPDILEIELKETRGDIALARKRGGATPHGESILSNVRVLRGRDELGTIRLAYTTANIEQRLAQSRNTVVLFALVLMGILSFVIYVLTSRITRPIDRLTRAAREIAEGDLGRDVELGGSRELEILGRSFIQMRDAVRQKIDDLAANNRRLGAEIAQRRQAEEERDRLVSIMEATSDLVSMSDPNGKILYLNQAGRSMLGIGHGGELPAVIPQIHPQWASDLILREGIPAASRDGEWSGETAVLARDGAEIPVSQVILSHKDAQGKILYFSTVMRDITDRRKAEEALRRSEERLSVIFYRSPLPLAVTRFSDGLFMDVNDAWLEVLGYAREGVLGRTSLEIGLYDDSRDRMRIFELLGTQPSMKDFEVWYRRGDGQRVLCEIWVSVADIRGEHCLIWTLRDITERRQAQEALRISDERLRQAVRVSDIGIFDHDQVAEAIYWSPEQKKIYGVPADQTVTLQVFLERVHPEDVERIGAAVTRAHAPGSDGRFDVEHRIVRSDGTIRWVSTRSQTFFEGEGESRHPVRTIGAVVDITEHKEAEETRALLAAIVETSSDAIISRALGGTVSSWNAAAERLFGYDAAEMIGHDIGVIIPPEREAEVAEKRALLTQGARVQSYDTVRLAKGGRRVDVSATQSPIRDKTGKLIGVSLTFRDIAERKRAEQALRESEARLKRAETVGRMGHYAFDLDGGNPVWSDGLKDLWGFDRTSDPPFADFVARIHPDDVTHVMADFAQAAERKRGFSLEHRIVRPGGKVIAVHSLAECTIDEKTAAERFFGTMLDITERKEAEQILTRLNDELERKVVERTAELAAANKELEAFVYSVSHDLRAPLRGIDGFSHVLAAQYRAQLDPEAHRLLERIRAAAQRMGHLISDLLQLSRLTRSAVQKTEVNLSELAQTVIDELGGEAAGRAVRWRVEPGMRGRGDRGMLRVALQNLLGNALKFTRGRAPAEIEFGQARREGGLAEYFVRDNGAGFDMAHAGRLFQPFQRLHSQHDFEGTGIGLATVQRVIAKHGGEIHAEGRPGAGATFYFTLPE